MLAKGLRFAKFVDLVSDLPCLLGFFHQPIPVVNLAEFGHRGPDVAPTAADESYRGQQQQQNEQISSISHRCCSPLLLEYRGWKGGTPASKWLFIQQIE